MVEAAAYAGFDTPWTVDYLARMLIVRPSIAARSGRGRPRRWSFPDLVVLSLMKHMLASGMSLGRVSAALDRHRDRLAAITPETLPARYLSTDGEELCFWDDLAALAGALEMGRSPIAMVVDLVRLRAEVIGNMRRAEAASSAPARRRKPSTPGRPRPPIARGEETTMADQQTRTVDPVV